MKNNLAKIRGKHGLTITALAKKVGMTKQAISLNEQGRCTVATAKKVAEVLGENIFDILGEDALRIAPTTEAEKEIVINAIRGL